MRAHAAHLPCFGYHFIKLAKYFYFSVYSGGTTPDGLNFKVFAPVSPQLKQ